MSFASGENCISLSIDQTGGTTFQDRIKRTRSHMIRDVDASSIQKGGSQVRQGDKVIDHSSGMRYAFWPTYGQWHLSTQVIEATFTAGDSGNAMVTTDHQNRIFVGSNPLELFDQYTETGIKSLDFTEIICKVLPNNRDIGKEGR